MLEGVRNLPAFGVRYPLVCGALGFDPLQRALEDPAVINENAVSSLLTVLTSSLSLDAFKAEMGAQSPIAVAGYSIGQWSALYAAGSIDFQTLINVSKRRADFMDDCFRSVDGGMLAVIGLDEQRVADALQHVRTATSDSSLWISNYNCAGQYSVAGTATMIAAAEKHLATLSPKKLFRLPVSGAWHCPLLERAATGFREFLASVSFAPPAIPVIDNVTGNFLPATPSGMAEQLAQHLDHAVRWVDGVRTLVRVGATSLVEIGFGNTLTKFGFFVDRSVQHSCFYDSRSSPKPSDDLKECDACVALPDFTTPRTPWTTGRRSSSGCWALFSTGARTSLDTSWMTAPALPLRA